jgi:cyanophycinase-like exopeptidase
MMADTGSGLGLGVDASTALLVETDGTAKVAGLFNVYFVKATYLPFFSLDGKLTMDDIEVRRVSKNTGTFNLNDVWDSSVILGLQYTLTVTAGVLTSDNGDIY